MSGRNLAAGVRVPAAVDPECQKNYLELDEAQTLVAQDAGFGSWAELTRALATGGERQCRRMRSTPRTTASRPRRPPTDAEWDELIAVMKERRITALDANGLMTDARPRAHRRARSRHGAQSGRIA